MECHNRTIDVIIGSETDRMCVQEAIKVLQKFDIPHNLYVISAHRTPDKLRSHILSSKADIFIAAAGGASHLGGAIASYTYRPVIYVAVPIYLSGLDSLLSNFNMPTGIPVACVGIANSANAAFLAIQILAINDKQLALRLEEHRNSFK